MEITNWQLFQKILSAWLLSLAFVVYSFYLIRNRKVYAFRKIIWSIACFWLIIDGFMDLLFSTTNLLVNYPFPIIAGASLFFLTLGIILSGFIYMIYFQWNLMCIYKINGKPISQRKQPILQKVSAVIMYIFLLLHFGLYGIFIHSLCIWGCNDSCFWFYESTRECWWESELDGWSWQPTRYIY